MIGSNTNPKSQHAKRLFGVRVHGLWLKLVDQSVSLSASRMVEVGMLIMKPLLAVDFSTMADVEYSEDITLEINFVDNPVVPDPYAILMFRPTKLAGIPRKRIASQ